MQTIEFLTTTHGTPLAVADNYHYYKKQDNKNSTVWRCSKFNTLKCRATIHTSGRTLLKKTNEHNHGVEVGQSGARQVLQQIKNKSLTKTATVAVAESILENPESTATQLALPMKSYLVRTANRYRKKHTNEVNEPTPTTRHFEIPVTFADILLFDSGQQDPERIIIFGRRDMLLLLETNHSWLADGTFKLSPDFYYQIYTIHVELKGFSPPCFYSFLPNKTEKTYQRLLTSLLTLINPDPDRILVDFETAAINAFTKTFPQASIKGCYFHLCQSFNRKINEVGLKKEYESNEDLALSLKMLPAMSFLPQAMISGSFSLVIDDIIETCEDLELDVDISDKCDQVALYFKSNYVENQISQRPPKFPLHLWNHRDGAREGIARTNNAVEGWHYGIQTYFSGSHPNMWVILTNLRKDMAVQKFNYLQYTQGSYAPRRQKYEKLNETTKQLIENANLEEVVPFLKAIAKLNSC